MTARETCLFGSDINQAPEHPQFLHDPRLFVTVQQASDDFGMPKWKFYRAIKNGLLRQYHFLNGRKYVSRSDIQKLFQNSVEGGR